jgi:hypothetical protein
MAIETMLPAIMIGIIGMIVSIAVFVLALIATQPRKKQQ